MRNAQIFVSCGQCTDREKEIGHNLVEYFKGRGFEVYFAERVHSSDALTQSIFAALRHSEYFVFVDFRRERLKCFKKMHRGSLFVNQEVAIATFLGIDGIGFAERDVVREGLGSITYTMKNFLVIGRKFSTNLRREHQIGIPGMRMNWLFTSERPQSTQSLASVTGR